GWWGAIAGWDSDGFGASSPASLLRGVRAALHRPRGGDNRLVRVHVSDGWHADARWLDDVDGMDADARADMVRRRRVLPRHVVRDDGGDDAAIPGPNAVSLPSGRRQDNGCQCVLDFGGSGRSI